MIALAADVVSASTSRNAVLPFEVLAATLTLDGPPWLVLPYRPLAQLALRRLVSA